MEPSRARERDWPFLLGPQAFAGRPQGAIFAAVGVLMLLLVSAAEFAAPRHATLGAITVIPIVMASWLLSRRLTILVVLLGVALRALAAIAGPVDPLTAVAEIVTLPVIAFAGQLAAVSTVRSHRTEARLSSISRESARMAALEEAKSDFMRLASHELRGPVAVLRGYLSMLEDGSMGQLPDPARHVIPILLGKVQAMNRLVDDMLETARLEDSRLQLKKRRVDLCALVRNVAAMAQETLPETHRLEIEVPPEPVEVEADAERVGTILTNLVDNAVKYSPAGGKVRVELRSSNHKAVVVVRDEGMGIEVSDQANLFTRFGRVVTRDNSHIGGTGLGLYISRKLARMHGGDIEVSSTRGEGTTFTIELPLAETPAEHKTRLEPEARTTSTRSKRELSAPSSPSLQRPDKPSLMV